MIKIIPKWLADFGLQLNRLYYKQLLYTVYFKGKASPSWFDHRIDLYYHWPHNLFWLERGFFSRKYMFEGCTVLDLFCGDGFYSHYFYATIAGQVDAVDKDPRAIAHAHHWYAHPNIKFQILDVMQEQFPQTYYDVVVWFEAIEHLSETDYTTLVTKLKAVMLDTSIIIGSTPIIPVEQLGQGNWEHQNEFTDANQLQEFLERDFLNVKIELTTYPLLAGGHRQTAYFAISCPKQR